jgi:DNA-binding MarR family transcriptional regulator
VTPNRYEKAAQFRSAVRHFLRTSEDAARSAGVTPSQHLLLLQIAGSGNGTTTVSELVDKLALTQSAVTELVQRAEQAGLVRRAASPADGRVVNLTLTADGDRKLAQVHDAIGPERVRLRRMVDAIDN